MSAFRSVVFRGNQAGCGVIGRGFAHLADMLDCSWRLWLGFFEG